MGVKPDDAEEKLLKTRNMIEICITSGEEKAFPMPSEEQLSLAGSWDDWTPHNMQWDEKLQCHVLDVIVRGDAKIGINKGQAGTRKWKPRTLWKRWSMGAAIGRYKIK